MLTHGLIRRRTGANAFAATSVDALRRVELHWYEAHGIGKRDLKIKGYLDQP